MTQNFAYFLRRSGLYVYVTTLAMLLSACTTVSVTPIGAPASPQTFHRVVVDTPESPDPALKYYGTFFREGFLRQLRKLNSFTTVDEAPAATVTPDTILVVGTVTEANKGSQALRGFIGFGAGRAHVTAMLDLKSSDGKPLGQLQIRKAYSGGVGMGGFGDLVDMEKLARLVGEQAAQTLTNWSQGKPITEE